MAKKRKRYYVGRTYFLEPPNLAMIIECHHGIFRKMYLGRTARRPRTKMPRGYWKQRAHDILLDIVPHYVTPKNLPFPRAYLWLLDNIPPGSSGVDNNFKVALAKDLGIYPPPKWYQVRRRLLTAGKK